MDEPYRVQVLHIVNPHLIYVESQAQKEPAIIEQVGIYGVLPINKTIDIDGNVVAERCENWPIAANTILREFLVDQKNSLYFVPIQVDERSTILNEKWHVFGDIIINTGEDISAAKHLIKLGVAIKDELIFHQKLASGSIKIKLNSHRNEEVINAIKRYYQKQKKVEHDWQKTIHKQTSLYEESKKITSELTEKNLKLFERNSAQIKQIKLAIERKEKDLDLCKDANIVSVGCGTRRNRSNNPDTPVPLKGSSHEDNYECRPYDILTDMKKYLEVKGIIKDIHSYDDVKHNSKDYGVKQSTPAKDEHQEEGLQQKSPSQYENQTYLEKQQKYFSRGHGRQRTDSGRGRINRQISLKNYDSYERTSGSDLSENIYQQRMGSPHLDREKASQLQVTLKKVTSPPKPIERLLIFCPDMELSNANTKNLIPVKVIEEFGTGIAQSSNSVTEVKEIDKSPLDDDDNLDSNVNIKITNMDRLKTANRRNTLDQSDSQTKQKEYCYSNSYDNNKTPPQTSHSETQHNIQNDNGKIIAKTRLSSSIMQRKLLALKEAQKREADYSFSSNSDTSVKDTSSSPDSKTKSQWPNANTETRNKQQKSKTELEQARVELKLLKGELEHSKNKRAQIESEPSKFESEQLKIESNKPKTEPEQPITDHVQQKLAKYFHKVERNVNPFKNLDGSKSVFVDKLITPILMVHTKNDNLILPQAELRCIPFKPDIHCMLKNMRVHKPKRLQSVSWNYILRGHSVFMISPSGNGKSVGYVPAVCHLVRDSNLEIAGVGPVCIIVCATALSVSEVENYCKGFLSPKERIVACFPGIETSKITTALLNGCHVLICTAPMLVTLLELDFGADLRRLMVLVLEDCERLAQVYTSELTKILQHVKNMLKNRSDKLLKVQYVVASRQWCDFMTPLARKAPDTVIAIGASQECVLYSKTQTSVNFVKSKDSKVNIVVEFMKEIDNSKRTVIVCREDDEVVLLESTLTELKHTVLTCNSTMTVQDLYILNEAWGTYEEPVSGPVLICCDGNLTHLNITNANYLVHFSMPALFSMFCKRFSVLNENYASIFGPKSENVKIKILLDETNVEQLPKILNFVKRCTNEDFPMLENVLQEIMEEKDLKKAEDFTPICNNLLMLGECIDKSNCPDRHTIFKVFDEPKEWMPKRGLVTFKITHFDSASTYSARVLTNTAKSDTTKYPNNYNTLSLKMGMYYSKEINRKLHGVPKAGDICAVAAKQNIFERCKVMRIIPSDNKNSVHVLINLIDQEQLTITKDVYLYYMPDDLKYIETHMVKVRLANIQPKDKDVTFSVAAKDQLQKIFEQDHDSNFYMRGRIAMTLGNCVFVDSLECCLDLSSLGETVVKRDFKKELLERHAEPYPQHIEKLKKLAGTITTIDESEPVFAPKVEKRPKWAHLDKDDFSTVFFTTAVNAGTLFVRHAKFKSILNLLLKDIHEYVEKTPALVQEEMYVGNIVLAEYPDDKVYERARIDAVMDDGNVKCFFVDNGDWRQVSVKKIRPITDNILYRLPFQAIECRLIGVKPPGDDDNWPEFGTSWLDDFCFEDDEGNAKYLFVKYFTKEEATVTGGRKYGVVLFDTSSNEDVVINKMMIDLNLAKANEDESQYIEKPINIKPVKFTDSSSNGDVSGMNNSMTSNETSPEKDLIPLQTKDNYWNETNKVSRNKILFQKPIRSMPLINSDSESDISDKWDVNVDQNMIGMFGQPSKSNITEFKPHKETTDEERKKPPQIPLSAKSESDTIAKYEVDTSERNIKKANSTRSSASSSVSETDTSKEISEPVPKSPTLVSQCHSDDIDISNDRHNALNILKTKLFNVNATEKSVNKPDLVNSEINVDKGTVAKVSKFIYKRPKNNDTLDSDDLSSVVSELQKPVTMYISECTEVEAARKPKLVWRQNKKSITIKIILIGVEEYVLDVNERSLTFQTWHNDTTYEFYFVLYGVVKPEKCLHSNKGQYIQVTLVKMLERNWLNLTKDCSPKKWIVYDADAIEFTSDDESDDDDDALRAIKHSHEKQDTDTEDEDFNDDTNFRYKRHLDD